MKKLVVILLSATLTMSLVACGSGSSTNDSSNVATTASVKADTTSAEKESATETEEEAEANPTEEEIAFEPFTAIDNDECLVEIKGLDPKNMMGYTVKINMENKSSDKTYMFSVISASVNGVDSDPLFATEIAPGKKANGDMSFSASSLKENGITDFSDIEVVFKVYDTNDWTADPVAEETFHIYPFGEDKATKYVRESQESDVVLAENDDIAVVLIGQEDDSIWGYTLKLFIENKSDKALMVSVDEASVNGYMADPFFAKSVNPGKCAFTSMSWSDSTLEENDIKEIETIEFKLRVYDENDWSATDIVNDVITISPQ